MKNLPSTSLLEVAAPIHIWEEAAKQAERSCHHRHRTGAVIFKGDKILSKGCSHKHNGGLAINSIHAEHHALQSFRDTDLSANICVVTITKVGNFARSSRPCHACSSLLEKHLNRVVYCEMTNDGHWIVNDVRTDDLFERTNIKRGKYASEMRM